MTTKPKTTPVQTEEPDTDNTDGATAAGSAELYTERAFLIALLTKHYPSAYTDAPDDEGWIIVYLDLPTGQVSWYIAPDDQHLFSGVRFAPDVEWDGHTTQEKYESIRNLIGGEE